MNETPTTAPIDIGARLRQARLKHGQSLDVVHQHTRIPKKFLEAMENNRFDEFPALVYLRGFLKSYCEHLDIEFEPLWNQISPQKPQTDGAADASAAPKVESHADRPAAPTPREHEEEARTPHFTPPASLLPLLAFLAVAGAIGFLMLHKSKPASVAPPPPPAAIAPIRPKEKMALKIRFHKETWVRLHCDGVLRFEGRAPAGFSQEWSAMNDFTLRVKSPEDVDLTLDGKDVKLTASLQDPSGDYKITRQ